MPLSRRRFAACVPLLALAGGCGQAGEHEGALRLGYFANITHGTALVGVERGLYAEALAGVGVGLETFTFNAGPAAIEALLSGALDAAYVGPNPAINAYVKSRAAVRVVAGAAAGGAFFVVRPGVTAADLRGEKVSAPQLGGTQDVALRTWLIGQGYAVDGFGGGDVTVAPQDNAQALASFQARDIAGAWVPEPWATRMIVEAGGEVLVDERDLWPGRRFATTVLLVRAGQLEARPAAIRALLQGHVLANRSIAADPGEAMARAGRAITAVSGAALPPAILARAWSHIEFTNDPVAGSLVRSAEHAQRLGFLRLNGADLAGLVAPELLAEVERAAHG